MFKYILITFIATVVCFTISAVSFSFVENGKVLESWFQVLKSYTFQVNGPVDDFMMEQEVVITAEDELTVMMVSGDLKVLPSKDGKARIKIEAQVKRGSQIRFEDIYKVDGHKKNLVLAPHKGKSKDGDVNVQAKGLSEIRNIVSRFQSSDVTIELPTDIKQLVIATVSGDVEVVGINFETLGVATVSGDSNIRNSKIKDLDIGAMSGDTSCISCVVETMKVSVVSGDVNFVMTDDSVYNVDFSSTSGDFDGSELHDPMSPKTMKVSTTSGDFSLRRKK